MLGPSVPETNSLATKKDASWGTCLDRQNRPNHREFGLKDVADAMRCESSLSREQLETVGDVVVVRAVLPLTLDRLGRLASAVG